MVVADLSNNAIRLVTPLLITPACDSTWHHVALTYASPNILTSFLDGSAVNATQTTIALPSRLASSLRIGWSGDLLTNGGSLFSGALSDLRIYRRALSITEIARLAVAPPPSSSPSASTSPLMTPSNSASPSASPSVSASASVTPSTSVTQSASASRSSPSVTSTVSVSPLAFPSAPATASPSATPVPAPLAPSPTPSPEAAIIQYAPTGFQFWKPAVLISGFRRGNASDLPREGLVGGAETLDLPAESILSVTDSAVVIAMPAFEGRVWLQVSFFSDLGDYLPATQWVPVDAAPLLITAVKATSLRDDPCGLLQQNATVACDDGSSLQAARKVYDWGTYPTPPGVSCLDGSFSAVLKQLTTLTVRGLNFGTGGKSVTITAIDQSGAAVDCQRSVGSSVFLAEDNTAQCDLVSGLVSGNVTFIVKTEFRTAFSNDSAAAAAAGAQLPLPVSVCPCGMYAIDGFACEACPTGASCAGAREPPRAKEGFWDRAGLDWKTAGHFATLHNRSSTAYFLEERSVDVLHDNVSAFPACAVTKLCGPNLECVDGAAGWMCVYCQVDATRTFQRNSDGNCDECKFDKVNVVRGVAGIVLGIILLLAVAEASGQRAKLRRSFRRITQCGQRGREEAFLLDSDAFNAKKDELRKAVDTLAAERRKHRHLEPLPLLNEGEGSSMASCWAATLERLRTCCGLRRISLVLSFEERISHDIAEELYPTCPSTIKLPVFERWVSRRIYMIDPEKVKLQAIVKLGLNFAQTLGAIANYAKPLKAAGGVAGSGALPDVLTSFSSFNDIGFSYSAVKCAFVLDYRTRLVAFMVAPFATLGVPYLTLALASAAQRRWPETVKFKAETALAEASLFAMSLTFLVLPASINTLAVAQNCATMEAGAYLLVNPEESCKNKEYMRYMLAAQVLGYIFLFVPVLVGVAIVVAVRIKRTADAAAAEAKAVDAAALPAEQLPRRARTDAPPSAFATATAEFVLSTFTFLIQEYRETNALARAWETLVLVRKSMLVGLSTGFLFLKKSSSQLVATMFLLSMSLVLHVVMLPFRKDSYNLLEGLALLGELAFCFGIMTRVGVGLSTAAASANSSDLEEKEQRLFDVTSLLIASAFVFFWLVALFDVLVNSGKLDLALRSQFPDLLGTLHSRSHGAVSGRHLHAGGDSSHALPRQVSFDHKAGSRNSLKRSNPLAAALAAHPAAAALAFEPPRAQVLSATRSLAADLGLHKEPRFASAPRPAEAAASELENADFVSVSNPLQVHHRPNPAVPHHAASAAAAATAAPKASSGRSLGLVQPTAGAGAGAVAAAEVAPAPETDRPPAPSSSVRNLLRAVSRLSSRFLPGVQGLVAAAAAERAAASQAAAEAEAAAAAEAIPRVEPAASFSNPLREQRQQMPAASSSPMSASAPALLEAAATAAARAAGREA